MPKAKIQLIEPHPSYGFLKPYEFDAAYRSSEGKARAYFELAKARRRKYMAKQRTQKRAEEKKAAKNAN